MAFTTLTSTGDPRYVTTKNNLMNDVMAEYQFSRTRMRPDFQHSRLTRPSGHYGKDRDAVINQHQANDKMPYETNYPSTIMNHMQNNQRTQIMRDQQSNVAPDMQRANISYRKTTESSVSPTPFEFVSPQSSIQHHKSHQSVNSYAPGNYSSNPFYE
jgi:hypothetical protein